MAQPQSKTVIVTGAGSGVGRAASVLLTQAGYNVVLAGRTKAKLDETAAQLTGPHHVLPVDLCDPHATRALVKQTLDRFGRIDALANVAGYAPLAPIEQTTPELWQRVIDSNLSYVVNLTAAAWPVLREQRCGVIVNISSMSSVDPFPGLALYAAAKIGLNMFTLCTAREGADIGVTAVALVLGAVETPMLRAIFSEEAVPRHATIAPTQVAHVIRDCITGARSFAPGQTITISA